MSSMKAQVPSWSSQSPGHLYGGKLHDLCTPKHNSKFKGAETVHTRKSQDEVWILERLATEGSNSFLFAISKTEQGMAKSQLPVYWQSLLPVYSEKWAQRVEKERTCNTEPIKYTSKTRVPLQNHLSTQRLMYMTREAVLLSFIRAAQNKTMSYSFTNKWKLLTINVGTICFLPTIPKDVGF